MKIKVRETGTHWKNLAECRNYDPEWWSLVDGKGTGDPVQFAFNERARAICTTCPVKKECKQYGYDSGAIGVILGGHNFTARRSWNGTSTLGPLDVEAFCANCNQLFRRYSSRQKYCATSCASRAANRKHKERARRRTVRT